MPDTKPSRRQFLKCVGFGAAASIGTFAYGSSTGQDVELVERTLSLPNWDSDGFRVGVLADPHLDYPSAVERGKAAVKMVVDAKPDLIVWIGDYLTSAAPDNLANVREVMELIRDVKCPCLGILGNHDYQKENTHFVLDAVTSSSMKLLRNESAKVGDVQIWGVDDGLTGMHRPDHVTGEKNTIVLFHEPDLVSEIKAGPSLQISGHSHGGQICMPGGMVLHTPKGAKKFYSGYYSDEPVPVYVSRGIGTTGPNWRLFCPPEATILTLHGS